MSSGRRLARAATGSWPVPSTAWALHRTREPRRATPAEPAGITPSRCLFLRPRAGSPSVPRSGGRVRLLHRPEGLERVPAHPEHPFLAEHLEDVRLLFPLRLSV